MGNNQYSGKIEKALLDLSDYQRREVIENCNSTLSEVRCIVSQDELAVLFILFESLKSRSISDGIDKDAFNHFTEMPVSLRVLTQIDSF